MSRNGSGTYNLPAGNPVVTGTTISSTWANTTLNDIANALTQSVASDGQTPMSANLNMATNKVVNVADPSSAQDAATKNYTDTAIAAQASTDAGTYLAKANNLSDVASASTSRTNLSAAKSGANSDITSLTGLTTALSYSQGGTGLTSPGTSGNVLTSNGTSWVSSAPNAGKILQVVSTTSTTLFSSTSTTPTDVTGISVTITPQSTNSKILVLFNCSASATNSISFYLNRNGTNIDLGSGGSTNSSMATVLSANSSYMYSCGLNYLDSPATTSAVTYKIQANTDTGTFYVNRRNDTLVASPATITVLEISGS